MSQIEQQIADFVSGAASEYAFPTDLSAKERKLVKTTAEKLGLSSTSFGMGSDRQIHIFKPAASPTQALEPVKYSVKNTFVDGPLDPTAPQPTLLGPAHQSMPVGALQELLAAEEAGIPTESFVGTSLVKVDDSPRSSEIDATSTVDSESEPQDRTFSIKNSFVHFETDSKENVDPRIIQSMPAGTFAENLEAERAAAAAASVGSQKGRPLPLSEDPEAETERSSAMLFPSTPNAETLMSFGSFHDSMTVAGVRHAEAVPVVQWMPPSTAAPDSSVTVLAPAVWAAPAPVQTLHSSVPVQNESSPVCFMPGTPVTLQGLANQPDFNGLRGTVSAFDADCGRYNIMLEIGPNALTRMVKVKHQNLLLAQPLLPPQPPCCPPMNRPARPSLVLDQML